MKTTGEVLGIISTALAVLGIAVGALWKIGSIIFGKYQEIQELKSKRMDESNKTIVEAVGKLTQSFEGLKEEMIKNAHEVKLEITKIQIVQGEHSEKLKEHSKEIERLKEK